MQLSPKPPASCPIAALLTPPAQFRFLTRNVFESSNLEETNDILSRGWFPHRAQLTHPRESFYCKVNSSQFDKVSLAFVTKHGRVSGQVGPSTSTYLIRLLFDGESEERIGESLLEVGKERAAIQSPGDIAWIRTSERSGLLGVTLSVDALQTELESRLQRPTNAMLRFSPSMELRSQFGKAFTRQVFRLCEEPGMDGIEHPAESKSVTQIQHNLISLLIEGHRHNYTRLFHRDSIAGPWQVRAAEEFIRAHAEQPLSLGELAMVTGVSSRSLQSSFQKHRGCSPMQFLQNVRLELARAELMSPGEESTVTSVAARWGFGHFGRFAADYRRRYSEAPSVTLRRRRAQNKL